MSEAAAQALPYPIDAPEALDAAAARSRRLGRMAAGTADDLALDGYRLQAAWRGDAAEACRAELVAATGLVRSLAEPLHAGGGVLTEHAAVLREARLGVDALRHEYDDVLAEHRAGVEALGRDESAGPRRRVALEEAQASLAFRLAVLHRRHDAVLASVAGHAAQTSARLRAAAASVTRGPASTGRPVADREAQLAALLPMLAAVRAAAGVGSGPPSPGAPPTVVLAWWRALTSDEQQRAVTDHPGELGALEGLPGAVRSRANEHRLASDLAMLRAKAALSDDERRWLHNAEVVAEQLDRVRSDEDPLTLEPLAAQLLVFDPTAYAYEGRAAVVVGDLDTADNVAFLVPGLNSTIDSALPSLTSNALRVEQESRRLAPAETTATVAWMGYDAPELSNVAGDGAARGGATLLADDVLGVQAARVVTPHLTVIGHSYGSTTVGTMLRDAETGADDVVLVGSPGPNVEEADQLRVPQGHVFVGASSRDPVSYVDRFGKDPSHESFGAVRFEAEDPTRNSWRLDLDDHSKYFNEGTESLSNIAHVVTGDYAGVVTAPYREEWWLLPDGINADPEADRDPTTVP